MIYRCPCETTLYIASSPRYGYIFYTSNHLSRIAKYAMCWEFWMRSLGEFRANSNSTFLWSWSTAIDFHIETSFSGNIQHHHCSALTILLCFLSTCSLNTSIWVQIFERRQVSELNCTRCYTVGPAQLGGITPLVPLISFDRSPDYVRRNACSLTLPLHKHCCASELYFSIQGARLLRSKFHPVILLAGLNGLQHDQC